MSGIIYKIICNETNECYVGSTQQSLNQRMSVHKCLAKNSCSSKQIIERNNYKAEIIEAVNYGDDKKILRQKEREWSDKLDCVNKIRPYASQREKQDSKNINTKKWRENPENKEKEKTQHQTEEGKLIRNASTKKYYKTDKGKTKKAESDKKYREGEHREELLAKKREYNLKNKEEIAEKKKLYREANKEKIKEQKRLSYLRNKIKIKI
jgi:hypothetical protein